MLKNELATQPTFTTLTSSIAGNAATMTAAAVVAMPTPSTTAPSAVSLSENKRKRKLKNPSQGKLLPEINARCEEEGPSAPATTDGGSGGGENDFWTKKCEFCGEVMSISLLIPHLASIHNKENVKCPICGTVEGNL